MVLRALGDDNAMLGQRDGFDNWRLAGANWQAFIERGVLSAHIATMTTLLDTLRTVGLNVYSPLYDAILARVLIEAAQPKRARHRLDTGLQLAEDTGMHFYDAGLLRLRAHTHIDPDVRQAPPLNSPTARARPCSNYALPSTISSCVASPPTLSSLMWSAACLPPVRGRNCRGLKSHWIDSTPKPVSDHAHKCSSNARDEEPLLA